MTLKGRGGRGARGRRGELCDTRQSRGRSKEDDPERDTARELRQKQSPSLDVRLLCPPILGSEAVECGELRECPPSFTVGMGPTSQRVRRSSPRTQLPLGYCAKVVVG